ncbi:hypothetical protein C0995_008743, partial [Termitomyces sp. Mi166
MAKSKNKLKKLARKRGEEKAKALDDAVVEISVDKVLTLNDTSNPTRSNAVPVPGSSSAGPPKAKTVQTSPLVAHENASDDDDGN